MSRIVIGCLLLLVTLSGTNLTAQTRDKVRAALAPKEKAAREKAAKAVTEFAAWCTKNGAYEEARKHYRIAGTIVGNEDGTRKDFTKLAGKADKIDDAYASNLDAQRAKMIEAGDALLDFIAEAFKGDCDDLAREAAALWLVFFGDDSRLEARELVWHQPLETLAHKSWLEKFGAGALRFGGEWMDAEKVASENAIHAERNKPWALDDTFHKVISNWDLSDTIRTLNEITRYRVFIWSQVAMDMEFKRPLLPLPVYLTRTRADWDARFDTVLKEFKLRTPSSIHVARYLGWGQVRRSPVLACLEGAEDKEIFPAHRSYLTYVMQTAIAQQVVHEGLKHKADLKSFKDEKLGHHWWAGDGLSLYLATFFWDGRAFAWKPYIRNLLTRGETKFSRKSYIGIAIANPEQMIKFSDMLAENIDTYLGRDSVGAAAGQSCATVSYFMREGNPALRDKFLKFAVSVFCKFQTPETFAAAMKGEDLKSLDTKIPAWLAALGAENKAPGEVTRG